MRRLRPLSAGCRRLSSESDSEGPGQTIRFSPSCDGRTSGWRSVTLRQLRLLVLGVRVIRARHRAGDDHHPTMIPDESLTPRPGPRRAVADSEAAAAAAAVAARPRRTQSG